ncbi:MAG: hypothetical protein JSU66_16400 [Deltaproteobacteria bacterium]|nr:MAG: hypothetical protein JSU66_16400 [Deltaproteobacteria bacterium]
MRTALAFAMLAAASACTPHARFEALRGELRALASSRPGPAEREDLLDLRGAIHVHSHVSHDSTGRPEELLAAARAAELDFLVMTDHETPDIFRDGLHGRYGDLLVIRGMEIIKGVCILADRCTTILALGIERYFDHRPLDVQQVVDAIRGQGGLAFVAHPRGFREWSVRGITGLEIYDILDDALDDAWRLPKLIFDVAHSYDRYPGEVLLQIQERPAWQLRTWDALNRERRLVGIAGNDAHQNTRILGRQIDPYALSFRFVTTHVLAASNDEIGVLSALEHGHAYVAFELLADASGFAFSATNGEVSAIQGDAVKRSPELRIEASAPLAGRIRVLRDGERVAECLCRTLALAPAQSGAYRAEVSLRVDDTWRPWILSNPLYVR